jgi:hypothetical protein
MDADRIIAALDTLTVADLRRVAAKVDEIRALHDAWQQPANLSGARTLARGTRTYRQEKVRCNKPTCTRCVDGPGHGPYWYAYWREDGKLRKQYLGKREPTT